MSARVPPLSTSAQWALAAAMLGTATQVPPYAASLLVEALDHVCWAVLASAGSTPIEARAILRAMWDAE